MLKIFTVSFPFFSLVPQKKNQFLCNKAANPPIDWEDHISCCSLIYFLACYCLL